MEQIQKAQFKDLPAILELQKACYRQEAEIYNDYSIPPLIQTLESIEKDFEHQVFMKVAIDDEIVASVRGYDDEGTCHIGRLIVSSDHQNKGLGKLLMAAIEDEFKGSQKFQLFTGFKSQKNLYLYEKLGYRESRRENMNPELQIVYLEKENRIPNQ